MALYPKPDLGIPIFNDIDYPTEFENITIQDLTDYVLTTTLATTLTNYALNSNLSSYVLTTTLNSTLSSYVTNANLTSTLANYTTTANLSANYVDITNPQAISGAKTFSNINTFTRSLYIASDSQASQLSTNSFQIRKDVKNNSSLSNSNQLGIVVSSSSYPLVNMTSNSTSSYISTASVNSSIAWNAFDGNTSTHWRTSTNYTPYYTGSASTYTENKYSILGDYLQITIPFYITPISFTITFPASMPTYYPRVISLLGSKDGIIWTRIVENTNITGTTTSTIDDPQGNFYLFRIVIQQANTNAGGSSGLFVPEIKINGYRFDSINTYLPNSVEIGTSLQNSTSIETDYTLNVNGDTRVLGHILSTGSGDVLCHRVFNSTGILANLTLNFNTIPSTDSTICEISYTIRSLYSSVISILVDADYTGSGYGSDSIYSSIWVNNSQQLFTKSQVYIGNQAGGGGTRSATIFPILGVFKHLAGSSPTYTIQVKVYENSDDTWTINSMNAVLIESNE